MTSNECRCGRPTRDTNYVCDHCGDTLARALGDVPWLAEQLEISVTRQKGIDYRTVGGSKGGKKPAERPSPANWGASEARTNLRGLLVSWARLCHADQVRHSSPDDGLPADTLTALSRWLLWRVDGLALHEAGSDAVDEITDAVTKCYRVIDRPADRQDLGDCREQECAGRMYAHQGGDWARCDTCATPVKAEEIRRTVLAELEDRLYTAKEVGEVSTYLGLKADRHQVRKYVEYLGRKGRVTRHSTLGGVDAYRFGEVYAHLINRDYGSRGVVA